MHTSRGVVKYVDETDQVYLECLDDSLAKYYRYLAREIVELNVPRYASHITIVRKEIIKDKSRWREFQDAQVSFLYSPEVMNNDTYWWLSVECDLFPVIRESLGLIGIPPWHNGFHMTIGNVKGKNV